MLPGVVNVAFSVYWIKYYDYYFEWSSSPGLSYLNPWPILDKGFFMYYFLITIQEEYIFSHILMKKRINRMTLSTLEACRQSCGTKTHIGNAQSRIHHHCRYKWKKTHLTPTKTLGWKKKTLNQAITQPTSARTTSSLYFQTLAMPNAPYCQKYFFPMEGEWWTAADYLPVATIQSLIVVHQNSRASCAVWTACCQCDVWIQLILLAHLQIYWMCINNIPHLLPYFTRHGHLHIDIF